MTQSPRVAAVLLAAGRSLRHPGQSKLCRPLAGKPLGLHIAQTITTLAPAAMIAVCGKNTQELSPHLTTMGFDLVWNHDPERGLSSSLAIGVSAALQHPVDAVLICLADMPFVSLSHLRSLISRLSVPEGIAVVGSRDPNAKITMPPAVFTGEFVDRLLHLEGDGGARAMLQGAACIEAPPQELIDFDDPLAFETFNRRIMSDDPS